MAMIFMAMLIKIIMIVMMMLQIYEVIIKTYNF